MKIYFAGNIGAEFKNPRLKRLLKKRRLLSYYYMNDSMNEKYLKVKEKEKQNEKQK